MNRLTDFFIAQRYYHRMSQWFYGLFVVAVLGQFMFLALGVGVVSYVLTGELGAGLFLWLLVIFGGYLVIGMLISRHKVKHGGMSIAKQSKAVRLFVYQSDDGQDVDVLFTKEYIRVNRLDQFPSSYRRYYEFAEQMAIASGVPLPRLYVLPFEMGVNGFVAGFEANDRVMVLTQGALEKLTNAELYGLIGHEFGHIIHGDARLNLRMYVMLMTLGWLYDSVDVFEEWIFGRFDKDYHHHDKHTPMTDTLGIHDKDAWVAYLKKDRQLREDFYLQDRHGVFGLSYQNYKRTNAQDDQVYALPMYVMMVLPVVVFRLVGVWGMLAAEWVKQKFNHKREFLADATSVQLTRSFAVVEALESLAYKYPTRLYHEGFSTCMGHFFFAEPNSDHALHSHPQIDARIDVLKQNLYVSFAQEMTADMDKEKLNQAQTWILAYPFDPKMADVPTPEPEPIPTPDSIDFHAIPERVIDGRLVVEDWRETDKTPKALYPKLATPNTAIDGYLSSQGHLCYGQLKVVNLPWYISKALRRLVGSLALYECVQACQKDVIYTHQAMDLGEIYQCFDDVKMTTPILPHELPKELLGAVAGHDRRLDGLLLQVALRRMNWHFRHCPPLTDKERNTLTNYVKGLYQVMTVVRHDKSAYTHTVFNYDIMADSRWHGKLSDLTWALSLLAIWQVLQRQLDMPTQMSQAKECQALLAWLNLPNNDADLQQSCLLVLMTFVVSSQDNSLALWHYDKLIHGIRRMGRLLALPDCPSDEALIALMYQLKALNSRDWLLIVGQIHENGTRIVDTLYTAFLYDGKITQEEYDLLGLLALMWDVALPKDLLKEEKNS